MLETIGDKDGLIRDFFRTVPTTVYVNNKCTNFATVVTAPEMFGMEQNIWGDGFLGAR